jgi:uncharacterized membrane protein YphA (DoxX/SURF4 family)
MAFSQSRILRAVALALRIALGAAFVYAAWTKLRQPWELFAMSIDAYKVLPYGAVLVVARTLPSAELAIGLLLMAGRWLRVSAAAASLLLLVFFGLMVRAYAKGMQIDCGCFGLGDAISARTLARDGGLLAGSLFLTTMSFLGRKQVIQPPINADQRG